MVRQSATEPQSVQHSHQVWTHSNSSAPARCHSITGAGLSQSRRWRLWRKPCWEENNRAGSERQPLTGATEVAWLPRLSLLEANLSPRRRRMLYLLLYNLIVQQSYEAWCHFRCWMLFFITNMYIIAIYPTRHNGWYIELLGSDGLVLLFLRNEAKCS